MGFKPIAIFCLESEALCGSPLERGVGVCPLCVITHP